MASFIGSATGTTTATLPSHAAGDLIIAFAFRDGSTTQPTLPAGWTNILGGGANTCSGRIAYKFAAGSSETSGTWTNATSLVVHVYRPGAGETLSIGASATRGASSTSVTYPALTLTDGSGSSWVAGFSGHRSTNTSLETAPSGMTARSTVNDATDEAAGHDTNGGVSSWSSTSVSVGGTSSGWRAFTVEIVVTVAGSGTTLNLSVTDAADQEAWRLANGSLVGFSGPFWAGTDENSGIVDRYFAAFRFLAAAIPQGSTITAATLTFQGFDVLGSPNIAVRGLALDTVGAFGATAAPNPIVSALTTAYVAGNYGTGSRAHNVAAIVQEIVDRAGWTSGANLALALIPDSAAAYNMWELEGYATFPATLSITFEPPSSATTWNPSDKSSNIDLTGGNLTATSTASGTYAVRGTPPLTGKSYVEFTVNGDANIAVGFLVTSGYAVDDYTVATFAYGADGNIYVVGAGQGVTLGTFGGSAAVIGMSLDRINKRVWFSLNGGDYNDNPSADPATNTGGYDIQVYDGADIVPWAYIGTNGGSAVLNAGATAFAYAVPSGFAGPDVPAGPGDAFAWGVILG